MCMKNANLFFLPINIHIYVPQVFTVIQSLICLKYLDFTRDLFSACFVQLGRRILFFFLKMVGPVKRDYGGLYVLVRWSELGFVC